MAGSRRTWATLCSSGAGSKAQKECRLRRPCAPCWPRVAAGARPPHPPHLLHPLHLLHLAAAARTPLVELVPLPVEPWPAAAAAPAAASTAVETVLWLPAARLCGLQLLRSGAGIVELAGRADAQLERTEGVVHGGAVPMLGQLACAAALAAAFPDLRAPRRLDTNTEFLRPTLVEAPIALRARVVHRSRRVVTTHAEIFNEEGKPTARVYETAMLDPD